MAHKQSPRWQWIYGPNPSNGAEAQLTKPAQIQVRSFHRDKASK